MRNRGAQYSRLLSDWLLILLFIFISLIGVSILGIAILNWWNTPQGDGLDLLITATGAFGTLILAAATFISIRYNLKNISEMEKEREQPIVKDEIANVINPAIEALNSNSDRYSDSDLDWLYANRLAYNTYSSSDRPSSVFGDPFPISMARLN